MTLSGGLIGEPACGESCHLISTNSEEKCKGENEETKKVRSRRNFINA